LAGKLCIALKAKYSYSNIRNSRCGGKINSNDIENSYRQCQLRCVCVCVCERERETERETENEQKKDSLEQFL